VHYMETVINEEVMFRDYWFVVKDQLFCMNVSGNVSDEVLSKLIENIEKIEIP